MFGRAWSRDGPVKRVHERASHGGCGSPSATATQRRSGCGSCVRAASRLSFVGFAWLAFPLFFVLASKAVTVRIGLFRAYTWNRTRECAGHVNTAAETIYMHPKRVHTYAYIVCLVPRRNG